MRSNGSQRAQCLRAPLTGGRSTEFTHPDSRFLETDRRRAAKSSRTSQSEMDASMKTPTAYARWAGGARGEDGSAEIRWTGENT